MNFNEILNSIFGDKYHLTDSELNIIESKYQNSRKCIDDNLDYFCKLCAISSYAADVDRGTYKSPSNIGEASDELTEAIDDFVYYKFCRNED